MHDGTGAAPGHVDLAIRDGRIVAIGELDPARIARARDTIDAGGLDVAPGLIDMHSHADALLLADSDRPERLLEKKLLQGVTTLVVGNCGLGVAPTTQDSAPIVAAINGWMTPAGVQPGPLDTAAYLDALEARGVPLNVATFVPHGPLRISTMGLTPGPPTAEQLASMQEQVAAALDAGAFGLSFGLIYPPGMYSATDELVALAAPAAERDRLVAMHVRGSSATLLDATAELIEVARRSGARVHHSHLEAVGRDRWPDVERVLALEDRARADGLSISHDAFPYTRAATMMVAIFPPWSLEGGIPRLLDRLRDPPTRARIRGDVASTEEEWPTWLPGRWPHNLVRAVGWDGILLASVPDGSPPEQQALIGRSLAAIAEEADRAPFDVVADLMLEHDGRVGQLVAEISGDDDERSVLRRIVQHPAGAIVSDAEDYGRGAPHPAHAGAFARALAWSREDGVEPLERTLERMTGRPAELLGLADRGRLVVGAHADLVVFDRRTVRDRADWRAPRRAADGVRDVFVNGTPVVREGRLVPVPRAGQVVRAVLRVRTAPAR